MDFFIYKLSSFINRPVTVYSSTTFLNTPSETSNTIALWAFSSSSAIAMQNFCQALLSQQSTHLDAPKFKNILALKPFYFEYYSNRPAKQDSSSDTNLW